MISDDFSGLDLSGFWTLEGPAGTSGSLGVTGDEKFLSLTTSTGSHEIGTSNGSARALQPIADADFEVEAKFLTLPTEGTERQGILVEEDAGSWLWFDIYSDGTSLYAYAASHEAGISTEQISITIPQGESPNYLRVGRVGDEWTFSYSSDGANWNVAGSFTYALQVSAVGPFAASTDAANGYTAEVDYFFDTATPISPEDGVTVSNDAEASNASTAVIIASGQSLMDRWFRDSTGLQDGVVTTLSAPDQVTGFDLADRIASGDTTVIDLGNGTYQLDGLLAADRFALRFLEANPQYDDIIVVRASSGGASILEGSNSSNFFFDSGAAGADSAVGDGTGNFDGLTLSTVAKPAIDAALTGATDLELVGVMLAQGEADALNLGNDRVGESNEALYATGLEYLVDELINYTLSNYGSQFNQAITPEVYIQSLGRRSTASNELLEGTDEIIEIQQALADSRSDVNLASASYDLALIDTVHLSRDGWHTLAERMVEFISTGNRGPEVQSIQLKNTFSGARVTIDLKLPNGFTAADIILGDDAIDQLEVFDSLSIIDGDDFDPSTSIDAVSVSLVGSQLVYELERQIVGDGLIQIAYASPMASGTLTGFGDQDSTVEPVALENGDLDLPIGPYRQTFTASEIAPPGSPPNAVDDTATTNEDTAVVIDVLANDTDPDLDPLTVTSVGPASNGQVVINPDDTVTYTPNADFNGVDSFQVTVNDGGADSVSTVTVTVNAVNDDPTAVDDFAAAVLDAPVIIDATANDIDIDGDLLDIVTVGPTANGGFVVNNGNGTLTYTRAAGFLGQDSFTYTVDDMAGGATSTANVTVYVLSSPNTAPVAVADSIAVDEDGSFNFQPGANDTDADGDTIVAFAIATAPSNGAAVVEADGTVTYTPTAGYFGAESFEVTVTDGRGGFDTAVVSVNVNEVNDDPVAEDDAANTFEGAPVVVDVLANDSDSDSPGPLTVSAVGAATSGTVVNNGDSVTYQPNAGFSGVDTFDYTVSDGQGGFDTATVTVNVAALPSPVYETSGEMVFDGSNANVIELDPLPIYDFAEGTISFEFNASSLGKDRGLFARDASGLAGNGNHIAIYVDQSTLKARLQDGVNTTFLTFGGIAAGASYDVALVFAASGSELYVNGALVDSDAITTSWAGSPEFLQFGSLGWASNSGQSGFRSSNNFRGTISDQKIFSEALNSDQIAELHTDGPVNLDPIAVDDTATTNEDVVVNINVVANDSDPDGGTPAATGIASQGADGTAVLNPDGTVTYTPNANFFGADSFQVTIEDGQGGSTVSTVNVTVAPVNDDPVANNDTGQTVLDTPVIIDVTANDMDADGDTPQIIGTTDGGNGAVVDNGDGTVTYTPNAGYVGGDSFTYTIDDGQGGALAQATVTVDVLAAPNTPPAAVEDSVSLGEDGSLTFQPGDNDVDADGDTVIAAAILSGPSNGGAVVNPDGTVTYTPNADFFGADSFLVQLTDGNGGFDQSTVSVTVTAVNDAPTANDDAGNTQVDQPLVINVLANDTDVDPDTLSVVAVGTPSNGQAVDNGDGTVTYTPNAGFSGTDTFTYDVNDGTVTRTATVTVAVSAFPTPIFEALGSMTFSGASADVVELAHAPIYSTPEGAVTFSFTASDTNGRQGLFTKDASGFAGGGNHLAVYLDGSTLKARFQDGANSVTLEQSGIQTGVEYDIAVVFSAAGAQLYVDSVSVESDPIIMDWTQNVEAIQWGALGWGSASGAFGYKNRDNFTGTISDKRVFDTALSAPQVAEIFGAEPGNFDPVAIDDSLTVTEDGSGSLDPAANDTDPDGGTPVALGIASQGANGTAALNPDGTVTYTPNANFFGADSFQVTIGDGQGGSAVSTVNVTVSGTEDDPIANGDTAAAQQGVATIIDLLANDLELDGETLSIVSLGTPSNGSVTENGDGTVTYTSDPGFTGMATFTYEISDGAGPTSTATATVTVTAGPPAASPIESDDFSAVALAPIWTYKGITGSPSLQVSGNEGYLEIGSPPGVPVDAYTSLTTPRLLQTVPDDDFQIEVKFLNEPTQAFQEHGLLVVQDATTWIRFDLAYTSSGLDLLVGVVTDSGRSFPLDLGVSSGDASHLRITRVGDQFTFDYSGDGQNWTTAITLNQTMVVNEVGPFAGSAPKNGVTPGWISQVDYFYNSASPIASEDGGLFQPDPPNARDDAIAAEPNTANTIDIAVDLLANDSDPDGDPITFDTFTQPTNGAIVDNGDGTLTYTPNPGFSGPDSFTYTIIAAGETDTATVTVNVETPPPSSNIVSDDFASPTLNSIWSIEGGTGVAGDVGEAGLDGYLILSTPTGNYDMWQGTYNAARAMQAADNGDFEIEAKFLTQVSDRFELQGIVVEQDADNWIRFDTYTNGSTHYVFAAVTLNGSSDQKLKIVISAGDAQYLRVSRSGDVWTYSYSADGQVWNVAGSFTQALTVTEVGPFAGSTNSAGGYAAQVDYFFNTASRIDPEDGTLFDPAPPNARDDAIAAEPNTANTIDIAVDLLANDSDPDGDPITFDTFTQPTNGAIVDNGDGTLTYTPNPGFSGPDSFTYTIIAAGETDTATVTVNVETPPPPSNIVSDDFASAALDPAWTIEGATGVTAALGGAGPERYLTLTTPTGNYDLWNARYSAARATQPADNGDFEVEAKFLTQVNDGNEFQGIVVEQDVSNWIRFDTYTNGSSHYIFAAVTLGNVSSARINSVISAGDAQYIRVNRIGDDWTLSYSSDGQSWNVAGSFTQVLTVAKVGPFAGSTTPANDFSAQVDYFFNVASPLADDQSVPAAPVANDDLVSTAAGAALAINIANDLLGNDTDQNEDNILFDSFTNPASGSLIDNGDGTLTYTPAGGFTGVDSFTYTATDGSLTDTATVFVDVDNQAPTAANDTVATDEDTAVVISVLSNDSDANGDAFQILTSGSAANGTVVNNGDGTVTYTPNANFVGADSFTYTISDGIESSTATVNVTVNGVDDAPQPVNDTAFVVVDGMLIIDIAADLLANDIELDGQTLQFVGFDQPSNGLVVDNGDGTLTYTPNIGFTGNEAITYRVTDGTTPAVAATLSVAVNEGIEVWYGDTQNFGALGEPQNWVNILGSVDINEVTSLSYTLNGGASVSLVLGPDTRRLQEDGDFNIEIDYSQLDPTATDDTIVITAQRVGGGTFTRTVVIDYEAGNDWAADYSIDWDAATSITDVVQVVDGKWSATADGLRLDETGYDRIVALGDQSWDFYEVNLTVEMHDLSTTHPRDNSAIAFGFHWSGHTDNPRAGFSPHAGWENSAGLYFWTGEEVSFDRYYGWTTGPNSGIALNNFEEGNTYNFKIRLEQSGVLDKTYSYKAWEVGATEPVDWTYQTTDTFGDPITGAFLLNAHYFDVTFGDVTVTEIQGSDIIAAKNSSDTIIAVEIGATNPGIGEIDVLQGGAGADVFMLGDGSQAYYDDGDVNDAGWEDFALIWDFVSGEDQVRLHGAASDYYFASAPVSVYTGDAIYRTEAGGTDELVAVFEGVTGLTLSSSDFDYENGLA